MSALTPAARRVTALFFAALGILIIASALPLFSLDRLADAQRARFRSHELLLHLNRVLEAMLDIESGSRGFVLAGDSAFLESYDRGRSILDAEIATLRRLTAEDPQQQITALEDRIQKRLQITDKIIELRQTAGFTAAQELVATGAGKRAMDDVRQLLSTMTAAEYRRLTLSDDTLNRQEHIAKATNFFAMVVALVLLFAAFVLYKKENRRRAALEEAMENTNADLEQRVQQRSLELARTNEALQTTLTELRQSEQETRRLLAVSEQAHRALLSILEDQQLAEQEVHKLNAELEQRVLERTRQLEIANKELESFSYSVSHDLRAPLRSIYGFSRILMEDYADALNEEARDKLQRICAAAEHMGTLIDDLLNLSRVGRQPLQTLRVDLSQLAQNSAAELQAQAPNRSVTLRINSGIEAKGDTRLLQIVMDNLIGNAWKYTGRRADAEIEFGVTNHNGESVYFVRDNGVGFDMGNADKLFGAFQRLHSAKEFEGTGVGLATVARIILRHGGKIWAEAEVDKGATFFFTLP